MEPIYIVILALLMILAVLDLVVGVSNDAVNFLNSATGSKAAPRWVILLVASIGILLGSVFSTGMMEIARSGVFTPGEFYFHDLMMIFLAVMITDVILMDLFNTYGLPTSTTVSLIFELLGASVLVALFKIWTTPEGISHNLADYINSSKALAIISGILVSVVIAFVCGSVIMFLSRLLFSFRYKRMFNRIGAFWCGLALTAISYFTLFKGLKGTTLISAENMSFLNENIFLIMCGLFISWTVIMALLQHLFKVNILKFIILAGTMALALAFAGNDLVNFIGVSMAGLSSFEIAQNAIASGADLSTLRMGELAGPVNTNWQFLLIGGIIMVLTIWFSKKARSVTETEVNLSRQDEGIERFGSTLASRGIVRSALNFNKRIQKITPEPVKRFIDSRFVAIPSEEKEKAHFDLIRASVNLTIASLLISLATSLKLPLSTTYVTFMVAMGSSLADRAWGRESAVYRITGVLTVISGWFMTALIAFTVAAFVAITLMLGKIFAIIGFIILCAFILIKSTIRHRKNRKKQEELDSVKISDLTIVEKCTSDVSNAFAEITRIYSETLTGLFNEDRKKLKELYSDAHKIYNIEKERKMYEVLPTLQLLQKDAVDTGHYYVQVIDYLYEVSKSLVHITRSSFEYIDNNHPGLNEYQINDLTKINNEVSSIYRGIVMILKTGDYSDFESLLSKRDNSFELFADAIKNQIKRVKGKESGTRNSILYLGIINETKTMFLQARNLMKAQKYFVSGIDSSTGDI